MAKKEVKKEAEQKEEAKARESKEPDFEQVRKSILGSLKFASDLAACMKIIKESGMSNPQTDNDVKKIIDETVRRTFGLTPIPAPAPYVPPPQPPQQPQAQPQPQQPGSTGYQVPPRQYTPKPPEQR